MLALVARQVAQRFLQLLAPEEPAAKDGTEKLLGRRWLGRRRLRVHTDDDTRRTCGGRAGSVCVSPPAPRNANGAPTPSPAPAPAARAARASRSFRAPCPLPCR